MLNCSEFRKQKYAMEPVNAAKLESQSSWINMGDLLLLKPYKASWICGLRKNDCSKFQCVYQSWVNVPPKELWNHGQNPVISKQTHSISLWTWEVSKSIDAWWCIRLCFPCWVWPRLCRLKQDNRVWTVCSYCFCSFGCVIFIFSRFQSAFKDCDLFKQAYMWWVNE